MHPIQEIGGRVVDGAADDTGYDASRAARTTHSARERVSAARLPDQHTVFRTQAQFLAKSCTGGVDEPFPPSVAAITDDGAAKAAVLNLGKSLAQEFDNRRIRVNCVSPASQVPTYRWANTASPRQSHE
jgi:NAD(P)-dependent dehydrogenase (short-subunit alcohol dehydrogenase family)